MSLRHNYPLTFEHQGYYILCKHSCFHPLIVTIRQKGTKVLYSLIKHLITRCFSFCMKRGDTLLDIQETFFRNTVSKKEGGTMADRIRRIEAIEGEVRSEPLDRKSTRLNSSHVAI